MEGAELILKVLEDQGVEVIFGYLAGLCCLFMMRCSGIISIRHIWCLMSGLLFMLLKGTRGQQVKVGVVLVTSGPGATNAVTGLTDAMIDSVPIVCLTGQVPSHLIGTDAFQEASTSGITRPLQKHNYLCKSSANFRPTSKKPFMLRCIRAGRVGVIDLPKDIQLLDAPFVEGGVLSEAQQRYRPRTQPSAEQIKKAVS